MTHPAPSAWQGWRLRTASGSAQPLTYQPAAPASPLLIGPPCGGPPADHTGTDAIAQRTDHFVSSGSSP